MADPESSRIFISYRREDSSGHVLALLPALRRHFGSERIFKDTDNIPPGADFLKFIKQELESCSVLLAIIGREWLTIQDARVKRRRLENPEDFLRVEVATALRNERIRVIPVLIERASMPSGDDLPADLTDLQFRNAIELSDSRWETDVQLLIQAIERAAADAAAKPKTAARPGLADLEKRRAREIAAHLSAAQDAFDGGDFERTLWACDKALLLDPQRHDVLELMDRARKAIDDQKITGWLNEARQAMSQGDIGKASDLIDQALSLDQASQEALALRNDMLERRRDRERERERARVVQAAIERAKASLDEEDFDAAVRHADDALAVESGIVDALDIRAKALALLEERRRQRELMRRAQQAAMDARAKFAAGDYQAALASLRDFNPAHELVSQALNDLQGEFEAIEQRRRLAAEEARKEDLRRAEAERAAAERVAGERAAAQRAAEERAAAERAAAQRAAAERALAEQKAREEQERQREEAARQRREQEKKEEERRRAQEAEALRRKQEEEAASVGRDFSRADQVHETRDENVQFTVFRRSTVRPEQWYPLLVFAHLSERRADAPRDEPDPIAEVQAQARQVLGEGISDFRAATEDSGYAVARRGELRFVPHMEGVTFNPPERRCLWTESVHREDFRMCADASLHGRTARGAVSVFNGNLLLAEVQLSIKVDRAAAADSAQEESHARPYRRIFASYSHRDTAVVEEFEAHAAATGDRYLRDVVSLRSGEVWDQRLLEMIEQADVFQLFWSWNALSSPLVRDEWRHALALNRPHFIRPVYWEEPLPEQADLPPAELRRLHFQRVYPKVAPSKPASAPAPTFEPEPAPQPPAPRRPITRLISYASAATFVVALGLYGILRTSPADRPVTTPSVGTGATDTAPPTSSSPPIVPAPTVVDPPARGGTEPPPAAATTPIEPAPKPAPPAVGETPARRGGRGTPQARQGGNGRATAPPVEPQPAPVERPPIAVPPVEVPAPSPTPPPAATKKEEPVEKPPPAVSAKPPAVEPAKPPVIDRVTEEGRVKDALAQYERGHDNLDAAAVRSVYPGAPATLTKAFAEYEFYRLEIIIESISLSPDMTKASAICRLSHFFQPRVGRSQQAVRRQQFTFEKRGNSWIIAAITSR
jgi:TIR domain